MVYVEPSFPRGRKAETDEDKQPRKKFKKNIEYGASTTNEEKPQKPRQKERLQQRLEQIEQDKEELEHSVTAPALSFETVQVGMLVMGCVFKVQKMELTISLPGRLCGTVPLVGISEIYNDRLRCFIEKANSTEEEVRCPSLNELYQPGDLVYVKIKAKHEMDKRLELTLNPKDLHSEFHREHLVEGSILSATIEEEEDHGYLMNVGIKNVRAFIPTANVCKNKMEIGTNLYCKVEKLIGQTKSSSTVILKAFKPNEPRKLKVESTNIDALVPGSVVTFTVETILPNGLQGTLFDDTVPAFVNENMLEKPLSKLTNYTLFRQVQARVLYVMPLSKHIFLTLANYDGNKALVRNPVEPGTVIADAKIISKSPKGVWFQIAKKYKGLLPRHIIRSKYQQNYDESTVMAKYQVNSLHKVRVIRYEALDRTIIVTDDEKSLDMKYFTVGDLTVGEIYDCRIVKELDNNRGFTVSAGNVKGLLTSFNFEPRTTLAVNRTVKLRLISLEEDRRLAHFSNRSDYMKKSAKLLTDRENIVVGRSYLGTVIKEQEKYFVVSFCNRITGIMFKFCREIAQDVEQIDRLKLGSSALFNVHEVTENGQKITLSIPLTAGKEKLGHTALATVTGVYATGADVYLVKENETGVIPPETYSDFPEHNAIFQSVLREGDKLTVVNIKENVYSCRDVHYFRHKPTQVKQVKLGQVLRAYCLGSNAQERKVSFQLALKDYPRQVRLRRKEFSSDPEGVLIEHGQVVLVKVVKRIPKDDGVLLYVSAKLQDVCLQGVDEVLRFMRLYLSEVQGLLDRFKSQDKPFSRYSIGQIVTCVVESFVEDSDSKSIIVRLGENDDALSAVKGIANVDGTDCSVGDQLKGRVVWVDVERQLVHVCVTKKYLKHVEDMESWEPTDGFLNADNPREFISLFSNNYVTVGCLRKVDCPLVIVPVKCHYNDFEPIRVTKKTQAVLLETSKDFVYGLIDESFQKYKDLKASPEARVRPESTKDCWLPDDYEEPILEESDDEKDKTDGAKADSNSDSGIDKDGETQPKQVEKPAKKSTKKQKKAKVEKLSKVKTVETAPGKILKLNKKTKKSAAKKLSPKIPFVISQLDGADDQFTFSKKSKPSKSGKDHKKQSKPFFGSRPTAKTDKIPTSSNQSGRKNTDSHKEQSEKRDKLQPQAPPTEYNKKRNSQATKRPFPAQTNRANRDCLPGPENFWGGSAKRNNIDQSSSDSNDEDDIVEQQPKKRLTGKERFEAMKQEEKRIRQIEEELADASVDPQTPDQFDRLVLSQPNSSLLWIRYMVHHMESAETEKARAVARRALQTINFREEGERLNVWIALLNLELRYETIEKFKEVLAEAIQYNDSYKVYSRVVEVLIDCGKTQEVLEIIDILQKRFRKQSEMWILIADCYYKIGQTMMVKPLLSKALKSLENKEHIPLIVKFAFLHNRHGDRDEAHILFEQILTSYPKRTDIWSQYVDMLVKDGLIEAARQTLDRAIAQRLPMRNMKTLYTKYVAFEEKHGDRTSVQRIKQTAADYVKQQLSANGVERRD
ncbi:protein RRP5 homolog [Sabethes cyaneus]|uniref:protein RRP5 homolog n=1 Tax=Sabethes cyaneus TaxID=53552 RepID=UPI00237DF890|nr:protein RRP5 homolog [Sabethes cyaneus]